MNINITALTTSVSFYLWILGVVLGTIVVNMIAKKKVKHVVRSTIFGFFLSSIMPFVFIQLILLLEKNDIDKSNI